jgi:hypothetical protein
MIGLGALGMGLLIFFLGAWLNCSIGKVSKSAEEYRVSSKGEAAGTAALTERVSSLDATERYVSHEIKNRPGSFFAAALPKLALFSSGSSVSLRFDISAFCWYFFSSSESAFL